jgi:DNA-binding transcriptional ArsR family regulator
MLAHAGGSFKWLDMNITLLLYNIPVMRNLDTVFAALSHPTRRAILARLAKSEATVMELAQPFAMSQPAVSRHLKVLQQAGLIARRAEGAKRLCRLAPGSVDAIDQWLAMLRTALSRNYERLDGVLADMKPLKVKDKR